MNEKPICPREDCDQFLVEDPFHPAGAWTCPEHGGPIWIEQEIELSTGEYYETEPKKRKAKRTEQEVLTQWVSRLAREGKLMHSISTAMSADSPNEVVIENHGRDEIDIRFQFSPRTGKLVGMKAYVDKREKS